MARQRVHHLQTATPSTRPASSAHLHAALQLQHHSRVQLHGNHLLGPLQQLHGQVTGTCGRPAGSVSVSASRQRRSSSNQTGSACLRSSLQAGRQQGASVWSSCSTWHAAMGRTWTNLQHHIRALHPRLVHNRLHHQRVLQNMLALGLVELNACAQRDVDRRQAGGASSAAEQGRGEAVAGGGGGNPKMAHGAEAGGANCN